MSNEKFLQPLLQGQREAIVNNVKDMRRIEPQISALQNKIDRTPIEEATLKQLKTKYDSIGSELKKNEDMLDNMKDMDPSLKVSIDGLGLGNRRSWTSNQDPTEGVFFDRFDSNGAALPPLNQHNPFFIDRMRDGKLDLTQDSQSPIPTTSENPMMID